MDEEKRKQPIDLADRTKAFAVRIVRMYGALRKGDAVAQVIGKQVLRSGTSIGAQYREACRARSKAEFISKIECVLQELDETIYWLELLVEAEVLTKRRLQELMKETNELTSIFVASVKTSKQAAKRTS